jgi:hypothetical protein
MRTKLRKGVAALVSKVRKVKFDKGQHIQCANCLKGSYVGYYAAAYGLTMAEAEELEKIWRAVFRMVFKVHPSTPTAHFYGGRVDVVADPLHGEARDLGRSGSALQHVQESVGVSGGLA